MKPAKSLERFLVDPIGTWVVAGSALVWCESTSIAGASAWGSPDAAGAREILAAFEAVWSPPMAATVHVVLDARWIDRIDPAALEVAIQWNADHREKLVARVRQHGIVPRTPVGTTLAGILPMVGDTHPFKVFLDAKEAFVAADPARGPALFAQVEALAEKARGVPGEVRALRDLLQARQAILSLAEAARAVGVSTRSLQRALLAHGTTFQRELRDARFARAHALIVSTDQKISAIASEIGIGERALVHLVRERTGRTPSELRAERGA